MFSFISKLGSVSVLLVAGLGACSSLNPGAKVAYADGMTADQYRAAYQIASARCDRQTNACSSFSSHDQCVEAKLAVSASDAHVRHCSNQVDPADVQACVSEIERGQCGSGIAALAACKTPNLCPYVSQEGTF
jgi:hypothetical protein